MSEILDRPQLLFENPKNITIITQSLDIIIILSPIFEISIISLGGTFDKKNKSFLGTLVLNNIKNLNPTKYFLDVGGVNITSGTISGYEEYEGNLKKAFINASKEVYLLAEYMKFTKDSFYNFSSLDKINYIISNDKFSNNEIEEVYKYFIIII